MTETLWTGEAPGRLDVLGGVADYSGSLVLQMPIAQTTRVTLSPAPDAVWAIASKTHWSMPIQPLHDWVASRRETPDLRALIDQHNAPKWTLYSLGSFALFCRATGWFPAHGLSFRVRSSVPPSMGVSSSAALEVATLRALQELSGQVLPGTLLARLAQQAENEVVGAPCGLMDQLASAHGTPGALLPILCRPDTLLTPIPLPPDVVAVGWPSRLSHSVGASPYAVARCAAFMGKKLLEAHLNRTLGFLTELKPSEVQGLSDDILPPQMTGSDFLARFGPLDDALSEVEPERVYPLRAGALFPVEENARCELAVRLLSSEGGEDQEGALRLVGEGMFQSNAGYDSIGLGTPGTGAMVEAIRHEGVERGFYGARVSGGGAGGTVAVLLRRESLPRLGELAEWLKTPGLIVG